METEKSSRWLIASRDALCLSRLLYKHWVHVSVRGVIVLLKNQSESEARHDTRPGPPSSQAAPERDFNPIFCIQVDLYGPSVSSLGNEH